MRRLVAVLLLVCLVCLGCSSSQYRAPIATASLPAPSDSRPKAKPEPAPTSDGSICSIDPSACPTTTDLLATRPGVKAEVYAVQQSRAGGLLASAAQLVPGSGGSTPTASTPSTSLPSAAPAARPLEMLDIEARFAIECESVSAAGAKIREAVRARGGSITVDQSETHQHSAETTLEIRVPIRDYDKLVGDLEALGTIRTREVKAKDVAKEYHDAQLLLSNLEAAMQRYEQLLSKANAVPEVLAIERELERLRARIDHIKGDINWMKDRVARATIRVRLFPVPASEDVPLATRSAFYPSLRAVALFDLRGESARYGYAGGGLGVGWHGESGNPRAIVVELDIARNAFTDRSPGSRYAYVAVTGFDMYSDLLGGGRRRFFNPYIGLRAGYGQSEGSGDLALGGVLGADLWKSKNALLELGIRTLAMIGSDRGAHIMIGPHLAFDFAF